MPLLEINDLSLNFGATAVLERVSLTVERREIVCVVGESGSGKTVTALSVARLLPAPPAVYPRGEILLNGRDTLRMSKRELRAIRGAEVGYVFQDPAASLNPVKRVGSQILEALRLHRPDSANRDEVIRLLDLVRITTPAERIDYYPHQLSGGMQQRVMIAMAIAARPKLLIADEPTTALDVTIQAQIVQLLLELREQFDMSILFVTHNLALVAQFADRVAVMYAGQIVETGLARDVFREPRHPYTQSLLKSVPRLGANAERLRAIPGSVPRPGAFPPGCRFHPRCFKARPDCATVPPELLATDHGQTRCRYWDCATPNEPAAR